MRSDQVKPKMLRDSYLYGNYKIMAYAIIETGGKQFRVEPGRFYDVERLPVPEQESLTIDRVLLVENDGEVTIGQPLVEGASIEARVLRHFRGRKVIVYKMKPKKKTRKKRGHRQEITRILVNSITLNGTSIGVAESSSTAVTAEVVTAEVQSSPAEAATAEVVTAQSNPVEATAEVETAEA